jgi:mRNA interferase RelE/StbE
VSYAVLLQPHAVKTLAKLPKNVQARLKSAIVELGATPRPPRAKKLQGERDTWRIRVGEYRVVYVPDDARRTVIVTVIGHRRDVYRR